jgi:hypothetical protein
MIRDVLGPKLQLEPHPSAAMACAEGQPKVKSALKTRIRDAVVWDAIGMQGVRSPEGRVKKRIGFASTGKKRST